MTTPFISIPEAIATLQQGGMLILVDNAERENEGDLMIAAEKITPQAVNFMVKHTSGVLCLPMAGEELDRLQIPLMVGNNKAQFGTAFTVSIEAAKGVGTGISASDRARTIQVAIDPNSTSDDIVMPGHIFPLRAREGGVLVRAGHTEGSVDLARLAGMRPGCVIGEIVRPDDGEMARVDDLIAFSKQHDIKLVAIDDLIAYRMQHECLVEEVTRTRLPIEGLGEFDMRIFTSDIDGLLHVALVKGEIAEDKTCLVRVHSECLTGDVFGSNRCDCGWQLRSALARIAEEGGVLLYMKQEGRGIGLVNKIKAYALQDKGMDTVEANHHLGFAADHRDYGIGSQILRKLGIRKMRLLTNNPRKVYGISGYGLEIETREPIEMIPTADNISYLTTKRDKLGHLLNAI